MTASTKQENGGEWNSVSNVESTTHISTSKRQRTYESRKIRKPLMEKKRRARINHSLNELKRILLEANGAAAKKEGNRPAKLEKADILELTLKYIQNLHDKQSSNFNDACSKSSAKELSPQLAKSEGDGQPSASQSETTFSTPTSGKSLGTELPFVNGFAECVRLIGTELKCLSGRSTTTVQLLQDKLKTHLMELQLQTDSSHYPVQQASPNPVPAEMDDQDRLTIRSTDSPSSVSQMSPLLLRSEPLGSPCDAVSRPGAVLIPTRMGNGEIAFVLKQPMEGGSYAKKALCVYNHGQCCNDWDLCYGYDHVFKNGRPCAGFSENSIKNESRKVWRPW